MHGMNVAPDRKGCLAFLIRVLHRPGFARNEPQPRRNMASRLTLLRPHGSDGGSKAMSE